MTTTTNSGTSGSAQLSPTETRLRLLENGYSPIPNADKACYMEKWPSVEITPEAIARWGRRHSRWGATGLRIEKGLAVLDFDIPDQELIDACARAAEETQPGLSRALIRYGSGAKEAWFIRCSEPFGRIATRRWLAPGTVADDGIVACLETFGGASARQFGSFGPHTRNPDGSTKISYAWADEESPLTVPLSDLPEFTKAELLAVVDAVERVLAASGWEVVTRSTFGESESERVYDLTDDMVFQCNDGVDRSLAELQAVVGEEGLRCSASWLEGPSAKRRDRCLVARTHSGALAVWEANTGVTHLPVSAAAPTPLDGEAAHDTKAVAEKLQKLAEMESERKTRRRLELRSEDTLVQAAGKLVQSYALCAALTTPVVPIWTDDVSSGLTMANFRLLVAPWSEPAVGVNGQPLKTRISPADLWVNSEQRVTVAGLRMRPDQPRPTFKEGGETYVNVYRPVVHPLVGGDPWGGIALLEQIIPDPAERHWLRQWTAYKLMHPGVPGPAVLMVARDAFGTGRSTWGDLLKLLFGPRYVNTISFDHFAGRTTQSQFTEWQADSLIVLVNESSTADNGSNYRTKHDTYERLKEIVDPRAQERLILGKYIKAYRAQVCASYCIFTNNPDALPLPAGDRRFSVLTNGEPRDVAFWEGINEWMRVPENIGAFVRWLEATDLSDYSPFAPPPLTEAKASMTELSRSDLDRALADALDTLPGAVFTPEHVMAAMNQAKHTHGYDFPADKAEPLMRKIIQRACHRVGVRQGQNWWFSHEGKRLSVYARSSREAKLWTVAAQEDLRREVLRNGAPGSAINKLGEAVLRIVADNTKGEKQ